MFEMNLSVYNLTQQITAHHLSVVWEKKKLFSWDLNAACASLLTRWQFDETPIRQGFKYILRVPIYEWIQRWQIGSPKNEALFDWPKMGPQPKRKEKKSNNQCWTRKTRKLEAVKQVSTGIKSSWMSSNPEWLQMEWPLFRSWSFCVWVCFRSTSIYRLKITRANNWLNRGRRVGHVKIKMVRSFPMVQLYADWMRTQTSAPGLDFRALFPPLHPPRSVSIPLRQGSEWKLSQIVRETEENWGFSGLAYVCQSLPADVCVCLLMWIWKKRLDCS